MAVQLKLPLKDVAGLVPEFDGKNISAAEYIEKLKQARSIVDRLDEPNLTKILKIKLKGEAYKALGNSNIANVNDLIAAIRKLYPISDNIHILYGKLSQILQDKNDSVIQYTNKIKEFVLKIKELKAAESGITNEVLEAFNTTIDADAVKSFKDGLKLEIKVELGEYETLESISLAAIEIENKLINRSILRGNSINTMYYKNNDNEIESQKVFSCQICSDFNHEALFCRSGACVYCKGTDHFSYNCRNVTNKIKLICKYCNQPGHSISKCKFNKNQNFHCQYCQEMGHEASQCPFIIEYEVCWKCKESGHNPNICSSKSNKLEVCEYCDNPGHTMQFCSEVICQKCNQKGHTIKFCKSGDDKLRFRICTFCEERGHEASECEQVKILVTQYKTKQQYKCQICDGTGHTAKFCSKYRNLQSQPQNKTNFLNHNPKNFDNFGFNRNHNFNNNNRDFTNSNLQRKFCEYCQVSGHLIEDCRKIQALKNYTQNKIQTQCSFCKKIGHTIKTCNMLKSLEQNVEIFCEGCKGIGHTIENCIRNARLQDRSSGNDQTLPGESA